MGFSNVLYRINGTENIANSNDLAIQMDKSKSVNLYKVTQDLGIIFMITTDPFADINALPYKILFGDYVEIQA